MKPTLSIRVTRFLFLGMCLMIMGCNAKLHKDYGYQQADHPYAGGILHVALKGKDKVVDNSGSVRGAPYNLFVWMSLDASASKNAASDCSVNVESLKLVNATNQQSVFSTSQAKASFKPAYNNSRDATFSFEGLNIGYDDYYLDIQFTVDGGCGGGQKEQVRLPLKKDYQEKKITFWDQLMGI
jgi:hypothetical protein